MSKLYVGFFVLASMLALSGLGLLGLVLITNLINLLQAAMQIIVYIAAYILVCIVGNYIVAYIMLFLKWLVGLDTRPIIEWMGFWIGFTERAVALTLVILAPRYLVTFVGGWILLKFAIGWQRTPLTPKLARGVQLALIANVLSFGIAIAVGLYLNPTALGYYSALKPD
jgi:hypothetical protein